MNTQQLLEQLLNTSKQWVEQGKTLAENKLNIPENGPEREKMLDGLKKGAAMAALMTALIGTRSGRKITGTAIKLGGIAAIGGVAFKAYKNWQGNASGTPINELENQAAEQRSLLLIKAMVAAANADGHIDETEQATIKQSVLDMHLSQELFDEIEQIIQQPLGATQIAEHVTDDASASEVYLATRLFIDNSIGNNIESNADNTTPSTEQTYLQDLIAALQLSPELLSELEKSLAE